MNRKALLIVLTIAVAVLASACSSSSPKIAITTAPPASMEINATASIVATVTHDSGKGVDWSCSPAGSCGSFNPTHTDSGAATVYTAPSASGSVTITAASTKKSTVTATASVTVNPVATASSLTGTYTFFTNGFDVDGDPVSIVGSVALDGAGNIIGGEQDEFDLGSELIATADPITAQSGAYTVGDDGRGSLTITPTTAPPYTLSITVVNNDHALIIQFDNNATTAGSLDLQSSTAAPAAGGYSFASLDTADSFVFGGVVTSDGTSAFTDPSEADDDFQGGVNFDFDASGGGFSATDAAGRGTMTLVDETFGTLQFAYYAVGPEVYRIIQIDTGTFLAGSMFGQGASTNAYDSTSVGTSVFGMGGEDDIGMGFMSVAGQFATDGDQSFTSGVADANLGDGSPVLAGDLVTDTEYFVDTDGYAGFTLGATLDTVAPSLQEFGIYLVDPALNVTDPNNASGGGGGLMLDLDENSLGAGFVTPQTSGASFTGNFAVQQDTIYDDGEGFDLAYDLVGQIVSDGVSSFSGLVDYNDLFNTGLNPGATLTGTFTADGANPGRATVSATLNGSATPANITTYAASSTLQVHIDTDSAIGDSDVLTGIVSFGVIEQQQ